MSAAPDPETRSATTAAANAFVEAHRSVAAALAMRLADLVDDPDRFAAALEAGFGDIGDPEFADGLRRVAPGVRGALGIRGALLREVEAGVRRGLRDTGPARMLAVAERVARSEVAEARWLAIHLMDRLVAADPERTWQLMRRTARTAGEWITVDSLASPYARGVLLEPYRWAEVEQIVYSPSAWERRLAGSTIARIPFVDRTRGRRVEVASRGLDIAGMLIGDATPHLQKAHSLALRSLVRVDPPAVVRFLREQAEVAVSTGDGARAWVVRDTLPKLPPVDADGIRARIAGVRRRPGARSTSLAAGSAARFGELPPPETLPMAPFP